MRGRRELVAPKAGQPVRCAGCSKELVPRKAGHGGGTHILETPAAYEAVLVDVAPGLSVACCASYHRYTWSPRTPCLARIISARTVCPGCGVRYGGTTICDACKDALHQVAEIRAHEAGGGALQLYAIDDHRLCPEVPWRGSDKEEVPKSMALALAAAASPRGRFWPSIFQAPGYDSMSYDRKHADCLLPRRRRKHSSRSLNGGMIGVELTDAQASAIDDLCQLIRRAGLLQYREGFERGIGLLQGIVEGKYSSEQFDEQARSFRVQLRDELADTALADPLEAV